MEKKTKNKNARYGGIKDPGGAGIKTRPNPSIYYLLLTSHDSDSRDPTACQLSGKSSQVRPEGRCWAVIASLTSNNH